MLDSFLTPISPNESIKFLMQHDRQFLRNTKEEKEESSDNGIKGRFKLREDSEIPTLFLSYYKSID